MQIQCALANTGLSEQELIDYFISEMPNATYYKMNPPPGVFMNAAFDWRGLLHDTAAVIAVGTVLWNAYVKFVEPLINSGQKPNAGLVFQMKDMKGNSYQVMLGKQFKEKEIFIKDFNEKISKMTIEDNGEEFRKITEETERSEVWVKIK